MSNGARGVVAVISVRTSVDTGPVRCVGIVASWTVLHAGASSCVSIVSRSSTDRTLRDTEVGCVIGKKRRKSGALLNADIDSSAVLTVPAAGASVNACLFGH